MFLFQMRFIWCRSACSLPFDFTVYIHARAACSKVFGCFRSRTFERWHILKTKLPFTHIQSVCVCVSSFYHVTNQAITHIIFRVYSIWTWSSGFPFFLLHFLSRQRPLLGSPHHTLKLAVQFGPLPVIQEQNRQESEKLRRVHSLS